MTDDKTSMDDLEPKTETNPKPAPEVVIGPNQNIENARLALPKSKYKPDYFAPKYASYIWKEHAPNFIKFIIAMEAGNPDEMVALTDSAIQDLSVCLEDDEKTLDIVARYTNLAMHISPNSMEKVSTADQIYNGMKYMVVTLSFIHARMVFIQLERKQFDAAEIYIMNFENRKWWDRALNANKRFGGAHIDEEDLIYEVLGQTFSTLKAAVFEGKGHYDMALKCFLGVPMELQLGDWKMNTWGGDSKCPERYFMTDDQRMERIRSLEAKWKEVQHEPKLANINPMFASYLEQVREDKDEGKLESVEKMMETGIFWATVKCPKCARNQTVQTTFFYNKCKMCRNIQVTALLGHLNIDVKYFQWLGKESSALDFSDEDMKRRERLEREEIELKKKKLKEKEEIIRLLKEKEAEVERLSREEEMAYAAREAAREAKLNRELTNQMLAEADKLLEETAAFQRARKMESNEPISDDFKRVIKEERRGKNLGDNILENKDLQNNSLDDSEETFPDLEDEIDSIEVIEEVIESFPEDSRTTPQNEEERREAELKAKAENQEKKLKNEKID